MHLHPVVWRAFAKSSRRYVGRSNHSVLVAEIRVVARWRVAGRIGSRACRGTVGWDNRRTGSGAGEGGARFVLVAEVRVVARWRVGGRIGSRACRGTVGWEDRRTGSGAGDGGAGCCSVGLCSVGCGVRCLSSFVPLDGSRLDIVFRRAALRMWVLLLMPAAPGDPGLVSGARNVGVHRQYACADGHAAAVMGHVSRGESQHRRRVRHQGAGSLCESGRPVQISRSR